MIYSWSMYSMDIGVRWIPAKMKFWINPSISELFLTNQGSETIANGLVGKLETGGALLKNILSLSPYSGYVLCQEETTLAANFIISEISRKFWPLGWIFTPIIKCLKFHHYVSLPSKFEWKISLQSWERDNSKNFAEKGTIRHFLRLVRDCKRLVRDW